MSLVADIKSIQRAVGTYPDGIFGPITANAVRAFLAKVEMIEGEMPKSDGIDERTRGHLDSLDPKARDQFHLFIALAKATAASMGCDYIAISSTRTWDEQAALYAQGRTAPGPKVTNARPGYSWHNFGTALDFGVFRGKVYLDGSDPATASRVHAACAVHAHACGLEWGGNWKGKSCDPPHYQIQMGRSTPSAADRARYKERGSVL
jgi:peptidoglycan L-alanyl-D-glutamate endopeptidase CwlK